MATCRPAEGCGVVRDEGNKPMEGVKLKICPIGRKDAISDAEGRFEVGCDPRDSHGSEILIRFLVGRYEEDNLAAAVEIGEDTETLDIKLEPGVILTGKATDTEGKGIEGAVVRVFMRGPNWDLGLLCDQAKTDAEGAFEVKAIPAEHKYDVCIIADGYGEGYVTANTDDAVDNHLDIGVLTLALANHSVSGVVVDADSRQTKKAKAGRCRGSKPYGSLQGEEKVIEEKEADEKKLKRNARGKQKQEEREGAKQKKQEERGKGKRERQIKQEDAKKLREQKANEGAEKKAAKKKTKKKTTKKKSSARRRAEQRPR